MCWTVRWVFLAGHRQGPDREGHAWVEQCLALSCTASRHGDVRRVFLEDCELTTLRLTTSGGSS